MAIGDNRVPITDLSGKTYWYNPNTGEVFETKDARYPVEGLRAYEDPDALGGFRVGRDLRPPSITDDHQPATVDVGSQDTDPRTAPNFPQIPTSGTGGAGETPDPTDPVDDGDKATRDNLLAYIEDILTQYGLNTPGLLAFAKDAIMRGWDANRIMVEIRKHPDYLADPLRAANMENARAGRGFIPEGQLIAYKAEARRLATQYGYAAPSDSYIAMNITSGRSLAELEHRLQIQRNVDTWGAGVRMVMQEELGIDMTDADLYELFDPEIDTQEWNDAYRRAQMRGRPLLLGLGIRSEEEARALEMLGVDPEEAFRRYQGVAQNASRFDRLAQIEQNITGDLPDGFGDLSRAENSTLVRALIFQDSDALAQLQSMVAGEISRFKSGGGAATSGAGTAVGLLSTTQRNG